MKKLLFAAGILGFLALSCSTSQKSTGSVLNMLNATWNLQSIAGQPGVNEIFRAKKPMLRFETDSMRVTGNNGCNSIAGTFQLIDGNKISFGQMISTKMACEGEGEQIFMQALNKVNRLNIDNGALLLLKDEEEVMVFVQETEDPAMEEKL